MMASGFGTRVSGSSRLPRGGADEAAVSRAECCLCHRVGSIASMTPVTDGYVMCRPSGMWGVWCDIRRWFWRYP